MPPAVLLRRLLLLPLLAPLLAVLLVGAINPRQWVGLRILIWRTPEWTIGSWLALAAGGGAALSATATALALQAGGTRWTLPARLALGPGRDRDGRASGSLGGRARPGARFGLGPGQPGRAYRPLAGPGLGRAESPSSRTPAHPLGALPGDPPRHIPRARYQHHGRRKPPLRAPARPPGRPAGESPQRPLAPGKPRAGPARPSPCRPQPRRPGGR